MLRLLAQRNTTSRFEYLRGVQDPQPYFFPFIIDQTRIARFPGG